MTVARAHAARPEVLRPPAAACPTCATTAPASSRSSRRRERSTATGSPPSRTTAAADVRIDATGCAVLPGFVDCHTHLPFAGWRAEEYEQKVTGVPYEEIARARRRDRVAARARSPRRPTTRCSPRRGALAAEMLAAGTTAFEGKTGYGLSVDGRGARRAPGARARRATASPGCSPTPSRRATTPTRWMDEVDALAASCDVDALDIYVESVAFTNEHLAHLGAIAAREGVPLRAHVEQFNANRSVPVALAAGARSVDHLACLHPDDVAPLAAAECAAVLLPGAEFLGAERVAPARDARRRGRDLRAGTDLNPGTSPVSSLPVVIGLAVRRYGWSVREALLACTLNAAWVLGLSGELGLARGRQARRRASLLDTPGRAPPLPLRAQPGVPWSSAPASWPGCGPTPRGGSRRDRGRPTSRGRLADLEPIGLDERGTTRLAWTPEDEAARRVVRAPRRGGRPARRASTRPATAVGGARTRRRRGGASARTSTACARGGRYDGALGVARRASPSPSTRPVRRDRLRRRGGRALQHADVRLAARWPAARLPTCSTARDDDGVAPGRRDGGRRRRSGRLAAAPAWLGRLRGFLELHIDQTRDLERSSPVGARARGADAAAGRPARPRRPRGHDAPRRAPDALAARRDPHRRRRPARRPTTWSSPPRGSLVEPNALTTIAAHVRLWLDAPLGEPLRRSPRGSQDAARAAPS